MTKLSVCVNPVTFKKGEDPSLDECLFIDTNRIDHINKVLPYQLDIEITERCTASCLYCYSSSDTTTEDIIPKEKIMELVDDAKEIGFKLVNLLGGDPLLHPDWYELLTYIAQNGLKSWLCPSPLISKRDAARISELYSKFNSPELVLMHIDTINQEAYNQVHSNPSTLQKKIQGYRNLLAAGYPPNNVAACITLTKPILHTLEETVDWYIDEMGANTVSFSHFKGEGFADKYHHWEPSLSETREFLEYRAKKMGKGYLRIGSSDGGFLLCRSIVVVTTDGLVLPCVTLRDFAAGNIYKERLKEIFEKHRDELLFNYEISGYCGKECENRDICNGCRANAYHLGGDVKGSDPKCFMNPNAPEYCYSIDRNPD